MHCHYIVAPFFFSEKGFTAFLEDIFSKIAKKDVKNA